VICNTIETVIFSTILVQDVVNCQVTIRPSLSTTDQLCTCPFQFVHTDEVVISRLRPDVKLEESSSIQEYLFALKSAMSSAIS
jgi:hypothetical protein